MGRVSRRYDRVCKKQTLNSPIWLIVSFTLLWSVGPFQIIKFFKDHDSFYLYAGICNMTMGTFGIWNGYQMLRAVVRRLVAEARNPASEAQCSL